MPCMRIVQRPYLQGFTLSRGVLRLVARLRWPERCSVPPTFTHGKSAFVRLYIG
jgi:hypothetical protein